MPVVIHHHDAGCTSRCRFKAECTAAGKKVEYGPQSERNASEPHGTKVLSDPSLYDGSKAKKIKLPNAAPKGKAKSAKAEG